MALAPAPDVPGFHALSPLGAGPSSTIFSAQSEEMGRWVALTIYSAAQADGDGDGRFRRAYELARRMGVHPHAVTLLDWGVIPDGQPYVVTEFYEHGTFDTRVSGNQALPVDKTLRIGIALAGALETAHRADIIHGGVHPARVLADSDDEPSLADTGLVPVVDPSGHDALLGPTNYHAPPEVLEDDRLTPSTDVYSLASTLYTLLSTRPPYWSADREDTAAALLLRILRHEVPPLGRPDVPPVLEQALHNALHSDPARRPNSVMVFAQALQRAQEEIGAPVSQPVLLDVAPGLQRLPPQPASRHAGGPAALPQEPAPGPPPAPRPGGPPVVEPSPHPAPTPIQRVFIPYPVPTPEPDPWFGPLDVPLCEPPAPEADAGAPAAPPIEPPPVAPPPAAAAPTAPPPAAPSPDRPLHQRLATNNPWPPQPQPSGPEGAPATAPPPTAPPPPTSPPVASGEVPGTAQQVMKGPRALPVIILGAMVAALFAGAVWMVVTGSDATEDDPEADPAAETAPQ